jgi:3-oxoacyl-[acyl-carrier protein] reductase
MGSGLVTGVGRSVGVAVNARASGLLTRAGSPAGAAAEQGATVNCINPGPVDTGYADGPGHDAVTRLTPSGPWGEPGDITPVVSWLLSPAAARVNGQSVDADGGRGVRR